MWIKGEYFTQNIITIQGVQDKRTLWSKYPISIYLWVLKVWIEFCVVLLFIIWIPLDSLPTFPTWETLAHTPVDSQTLEDIITRPYKDRYIENVVSEPTPWISIILTFLGFTVVYFIVGDPLGLDPITNLIKSSTDFIKTITYPLHAETIAENAKHQSCLINDLTQEVARLSKERNDIIRTSPRRLSQLLQESSTSPERKDIVEGLKREISRLIPEVNDNSTQTDKIIEDITSSTNDQIISNQSTKLSQASDVIFTDPNVTASNLYIRINKLTDDIARLTSERDKVILDKTIQGEELEKISKLAKESGNTISNQSLQINDLKEKVTHLNDSLKEAIDTGVTQVVELANKLNKVLTERNTLADEGKKMSDNLKDALNTIDSINNYWGNIGHKMGEGCPTAEWIFNNIEILKELHKEILNSGGAATQINLSLANDLSVSISELIAILS